MNLIDMKFQKIRDAGADLTHYCHDAAKSWWVDADGEDVRSYKPKHLMTWIASKLMLGVSELSEGMEGLRKNKQDDHLPQYPMLAVELADCVIRCFDLAGGLGFNLGEIIAAKMKYNSERADHKPENRHAAGGKAI